MRPVGQNETSAYIRYSDTEQLVVEITRLFEAEGMRRIEHSPITMSYQPSIDNNYWSVLVLPGQAGWHLLLSLPEELLCGPGKSGAGSRFLDLCETLKSPGFIQEVQSLLEEGGPSGRVVLESDGQGNSLVSGNMYRPGMESVDDTRHWFGWTIPEHLMKFNAKAGEPRVDLPLIGANLPTTWERDDEALSTIDDAYEPQLCGEYAQRLAGLNVSRFWLTELGWRWLLEAVRHGEDVALPGGIILTFEWPQLNRTYPNESDAGIDQRAYMVCCYEKAKAPEEKASLTVEHLLSRARQGDTEAMYLIGCHYANGTGGVSENALVANQWFEPAAILGHAGAQGAWGWAKLNGQGVPRSSKTGEYWLLESARQGDRYGQIHHYLYFPSIKFDGPGNVAEAFRWLSGEAESGHVWAMFLVGRKYEAGDDVEQDYHQAAYWYRKAAEHGVREAQCSLGNLYRQGLGMARNLAQAKEWLGKSAQQNYAAAKKALEELER